MQEHRSLEDSLATMERRVENAIDSASRSVAALKRAHKAAKTGDLASLKKALSDQRDLSRAAQEDASMLAQSWPYTDDDERRLFEDGSFVQEVLQTAARQGVVMSEQDGMLMCYPVIVRPDPPKHALTIDRKVFRRTRPTALVAHLSALQKKPARIRPAQFLESLYSAWEYARYRRSAGKLLASDVRVNDVYEVLTVAPGSSAEYSRQEFGRDLYLLERSDVRETRTGARVHFGRSTGTKERGAIVVVGEDGDRLIYSSIDFTTG